MVGLKGLVITQKRVGCDECQTRAQDEIPPWRTIFRADRSNDGTDGTPRAIVIFRLGEMAGLASWLIQSEGNESYSLAHCCTGKVLTALPG